MAEPDLDVIWDGDLLGRREDAQKFAAFLSAAGGTSLVRDDMKSFVVAVDADYGVGKTYFLRRLVKQLSAMHPVAYVDAWSDDLADEPLTALAATLTEALKPIAARGAVKSSMHRVLTASGKIVAAGAAGAAKRLVDAAVGAGTSQLVEQILKDASDEQQDAAAAIVSGAAKDAFEAAPGAITSTQPNKLMLERVAAFKQGRSAIAELKSGLSGVVASLESASLKSPIIIVIDELDRCRPTYAIKLLEEIKHLFDVEGLVFVLGMNFDQLARSVKGRYGPEFDGASYLGKFISHKYRLKLSEFDKLFDLLLAKNPAIETKLQFPRAHSGERPIDLTTSQILARYMRAYGAQTRDALRIFGRLQVCASLTGKLPLAMPYLVPLLAAEMQNKPRGAMPEVRVLANLGFEETSWDGQTHRSRFVGFQQLAEQMANASAMSRADVNRRVNADTRLSLAEECIFPLRDYAGQARVPLADPSRYIELIEEVGKFDPIVGD